MVVTYRDAGVNMDRGDELVERIKPFAKMTRISEVLGDVGGFAGLCRVPTDIEEPVLVSGTDGVGTKLKLAFRMNRHDTIGCDLVGMCVNDVLTTGARPLFFLDYFATSKLDLPVAETVIAGIASACKESGCALLGGETAELPGMYQPGEYDLAGFAVGVVARSKIIDGSRVRAGDRVLGLRSSGLHSNGYSLARKIFEERLSDRPVELGGETIGEALLRPTRLYARVTTALVSQLEIRAMSHITGGGIVGNLPRVLPEGLGVRLSGDWKRAPIFDLLEREGPVELSEMRRTFNLGIGFIVLVAPENAERALRVLAGVGEEGIVLGTVEEVSPSTPFEERVVWG